MREIEAVYENGVFRPVEPVDLPEHTHVRVVVPVPARQQPPEVRDVLSRRYASGVVDTAARHDELR